MEFEEIKKLTNDQLEMKIYDWKKELTKLRIQSMIEKKAEKPHMFKKLKKYIAQAQTVRAELLKGELV